MRKLQPISDSEMEIMRAVWEEGGPVSSAQLRDRLENRAWKPTTILTFLSRLCEKGLLRAEKQGKANVYTPLVAEQEYKRFETRSFLSRVYGGSVQSFLAALAEDDGITEKEVRELREWFEKQEKRQDGD